MMFPYLCKKTLKEYSGKKTLEIVLDSFFSEADTHLCRIALQDALDREEYEVAGIASEKITNMPKDSPKDLSSQPQSRDQDVQLPSAAILVQKIVEQTT